MASQKLTQQQAIQIARTVDWVKDRSTIPELLTEIDPAIGAVATEAVKHPDWRARLWLLGAIVVGIIGAGEGAEGWTNTLDKFGLLERVREAIGTSESSGNPEQISQNVPEEHRQNAPGIADDAESNEGKTNNHNPQPKRFTLYQPGETPGESIIRGGELPEGDDGEP